MKTSSAIALLFLLNGCYLFRGVHQEHLDSWKGQSVKALEAHPEFGIPDVTNQLTDGRTVYSYKNCTSGGGRVWTDNDGKTHGSYSGPVCCTNNFTIRDETIESYTLKGRCYTDDTLYPLEKRPPKSTFSKLNPF